MPLIKSKSKKAFEHNVKSEIESGKPKDQDLAIAFSVKRKPKKMFDGGAVIDRLKSEYEGVKEAVKTGGTQHSVTKQAEAQRQNPEPKREHKQGPPETFKRPGSFAEGGVVKKSPIKQTRMTESSIIKAKPLDEVLEEQKHYANGGVVSLEEAAEDNKPPMPKAKPDNERPPKDEYMDNKMAEGGAVFNEMEEEHHASIAAAIMAKKAKESQLVSDSDIDEMVKMYEGGMVSDGQVDIMENGAEHPNFYYERNEDDVLKENFNSDIADMAQPEDSNLHADPREASEENEHDQSLVSRIRKKMSSKR